MGRERLSRLRSQNDAGAGLVEVLVTMMIFTVVLIAVTAVFISVVDVSRTASARTSTTADARIAMEAMTRSLRVAVVPPGQQSAITSATPNQIQFYSSLRRGTGQDATRPTRVTYSYNSATGCVNENQVLATGPASAPVWTGAGTTKCLIRTNAAPAFTYFTEGQIRRADGTIVNPVPAPTDTTTRARIVSIEITLDVQDRDRTDVNGVIARDRVTLVNVRQIS